MTSEKGSGLNRPPSAADKKSAQRTPGCPGPSRRKFDNGIRKCHLWDYTNPNRALNWLQIVKAQTDFFKLPGLHVTVDRVVYQSLAGTPPDRPHCFVYFITIHNDSDIPVTIKGRKWVVTNADGEITAVEGEGVVGEFLIIEAGEEFSYNSFHLLRTSSAVAEGSYLGVDALGRKVVARIPRFEMRVPSS